MLKLIYRISLGITVFALAGCAPIPLDGKAIYEHMNKTDYRSWALWPGQAALHPSTFPHGSFTTVYANKPALNAIQGKAETLPDGAVVIAENFKPDKTLGVTTVMYKKKGYNPQAGDWFWVRYDVNGKVRRQGILTSCIKCHQRQKQNDYLFSEF